MFEKLGQLAERTSLEVSRRQFLGRCGRAALAAASAIAGILALPTIADAARRPPIVCDSLSQTSCIGKPVGSTCYGTLSFVGTCKSAQRKSTHCICS